MPDGERVALARLREDFAELGVRVLPGCSAAKSNLDSASRNDAEASSKYGVPGPILGRVAQTAPAGMKASWPSKLEPNPTQFRSEQPSAGIVHLQRIRAAKVYGDGGRRIDGELTRQRPDVGVNRSTIEREPVVSVAPSDSNASACSVLR